MGRRSGELISERRPSASPSLRLTACLAAAVLLSTCTASDAATPSTGASPSAGAGTLRVAMTQPAYQGFDPQASDTETQWEVLRCCLDRTLLAYPGLPNYVGTQPVPDLASGPPVISADGMTWTFHLRRGLHYAPPLQNVEIMSQDFVRALLRAGSDQASGPGSGYLTVIQGFSEYAAGAAAIAGVSTPDAFTLQVQETKPDRSLAYLFAMPFTAPIPPLPGDAAAMLGVATGHPFVPDDSGSPSAQGYGPFLVASGPYMVEGADALNFSAPPNRQQPVAGFSPSWVDTQKEGSLTLVRNPSWSAATDPVRPAYPNRIEITIQPLRDPYRGFASGPYATVIGDSPPLDVLRRFETSPALRSQIAQTTGNTLYFGVMNLAQRPFDDPSVRDAIALALNRTVLAGSTSRDSPTSPTSHVVPDPMDGSLLSSWDPYRSNGGMGDVLAAKAEMGTSRYAHGSGTCSDPVCKSVRVLVRQPPDVTDRETALTKAMIRERLGDLGIQVVFPKRAVCSGGGLTTHVGLCIVSGWIADYPDAGNMFEFMSSSALAMGYGPTFLGATRDQLRRWHYPVSNVPSIDREYALCAALEGTAAALCWARLDQLVVEGLHAVIPIVTTEVVRLKAADITAFSLDQSFGEPALDRMRPSS